MPQVTGLSVQEFNGKRHLVKDGKILTTVSLDEALFSLIQFLKGFCSQQRKTFLFLVAHNGKSFDMPIILRAIKGHKELYTALEENPILFVDSGKILRKKLKCDSKKKTSCSLGSIYRKIFKSEFEAHNAIEDVKASGRILLSESLTLIKRELTE